MIKPFGYFILVTFILLSHQEVFADFDYQISGRIVDFRHKAVSHVHVRLMDPAGNILRAIITDDSGSFSFVHKNGSKYSLSAIPTTNSGLASALVENIPGDVNRNFVITLRRGFHLSGHVVNQGHGLKGLQIKISPVNSDDPDSINAGGAAKTNGDGSFDMTVTPGPKKLVIFNDKYPNLVGRYEIRVTITSDEELPEIVLLDLP